jgi:GNAT superfamily N-acetyltransferase
MNFEIRLATLDDVPELRLLIGASARGLGQDDYSPEQIEGALGSAWGVDTRLIRDGTYFVVLAAGTIVACGGWSKREAIFGADALTRAEPNLLDPARDSARIRAFFVHPAWARRGLGRMLLERCEQEARVAGYRSAQLMATLPGERLYRAFGYVASDSREYPLPNGRTIKFIPMRKERI